MNTLFPGVSDTLVAYVAFGAGFLAWLFCEIAALSGKHVASDGYLDSGLFVVLWLSRIGMALAIYGFFQGWFR